MVWKSKLEGNMPERVWLITGASRGFGAEISKAALAAGDRLVATARDVTSLNYLGGNERLFTAPLDVTDEIGVNESVHAALGHFGHIDVLVNNAGISLLGAVEESTGADVERLYRTNVFGLLNVTRAVLPGMRARRRGHIINMSSVAGYSAYQGFGVYSSTKFAVEGLSEALHLELAPLGIRVTVVEPGFFRTDILDSSKSLFETSEQIADYAETAGAMRDAVPGYNRNQPGDPAKLARAVVEIVHTPEPPLRLPLGPDTLARMAEKNALIEKETSAWRALAASTDF
jgi:NAD(P)-dependent dehydrogenase (short-subunit alcohol dehydrogenase family)